MYKKKKKNNEVAKSSCTRWSRCCWKEATRTRMYVFSFNETDWSSVIFISVIHETYFR